MKRRDALRGLVALPLLQTMLAEALAAGPTTGLREFSGDVTVNGQPAREGMPIKPGDTVVSGPDSRAIYVVGQDAFLQRERSSVQMLGDTTRAGLRVATGKLLSVFAKGDKRIETPTATIGIRGTGCYIEAEPGRDYFCLCYGAADVVLHGKPEKTQRIVTEHHDQPLYLYGNGDSMMVPATVKNHTDLELTLLENLVGRYPPFYGKISLGDY